MKLRGPLEASKSSHYPEFRNVSSKIDDFRAKKSQRELKVPAPYEQVINKLWTSNEQVMNKSWTILEQV